MIPIIIWFLIRRAGRSRKNIFQKRLMMFTQKYFQVFLALFVIALCMLGFYFSSRSQERTLEYKILRNGKQIGWLHAMQSNSGSHVETRVESEVHFRMIFSFSASSKEASTYENGVLHYSTFYRTVNGREKSNKKTEITENGYLVRDNDGQKKLKLAPVRISIISLYHNEPTSDCFVYSDNLEQILEMKKLGEHQFRLNLPNGDTNYYTYKNGICSTIEMYSTLFTVQFVLNPN